jgi:hypothetical protein
MSYAVARDWRGQYVYNFRLQCALGDSRGPPANVAATKISLETWSLPEVIPAIADFPNPDLPEAAD